MIGAWLKVNAAAVALLVIAAGAGVAAAVVPGNDDGGDAFCDAARDVSGALDADDPVGSFVTSAQSSGQLDTLIAEAPNDALRDDLTVLQRAATGQQVDPGDLLSAGSGLARGLDAACDLDVTETTTTTSSSTAPTTTATKTPTTAATTTTTTTTSTTTTSTTTTSTAVPPPTDPAP